MSEQDESAATKPPRKPAGPRNNFKHDALYKNSKALELQNRTPGYVYQSFSTDPESPAYIGKRLVAHERGTAAGGYVSVGAWEIVHSQTDKQVRQLDPREDQGKPIDTVMRYGRQIMCRLPVEEFAKYQVAETAGQKALEKTLYEPDHLQDGNTSMTAVVSADENADKMQLLRNSGHPLPG